MLGLLFLLYINDINESTNDLKFYLFANDTTIFYSDKKTETVVYTELRKVSDRQAANRRSLNVDKLSLLTFSLRKTTSITLLINNTELPKRSNMFRCTYWLKIERTQRLTKLRHVCKSTLKKPILFFYPPLGEL